MGGFKGVEVREKATGEMPSKLESSQQTLVEMGKKLPDGAYIDDKGNLRLPGKPKKSVDKKAEVKIIEAETKQSSCLDSIMSYVNYYNTSVENANKSVQQ